MNIADQLSVDLSRQNTDYVAHYIDNDPVLFGKLMGILFHGTHPLPVRASWAITAVTDRHPLLLEPYLGKIIENLNEFSQTGIHRNLLRQIAKTAIPGELQGRLFDICYQWLWSRNEPPAVKVHCMQVLFNISESEPGLKPELLLIFEELLHHDSPAIRSRCRQLLARR